MNFKNFPQASLKADPCPHCGKDGDVRVAFVRDKFPYLTNSSTHFDATGEALLVCANCYTTGRKAPRAAPRTF